MDLYAGVGHGRKPDGTFDPGAVSGGLVEHDLAHSVVDAYARGLKRSGVRVVSESHSGPGHDPNFEGSARRANELGVKVADEIHFNAGGGTGVEVLVHPGTSEANKNACRAIAQGIAAVLGIPVRRDRGLFVTKDFKFLKLTRMPAAIIEVAFLDHPADRRAITKPNALEAVGEEIAKARCKHLGTPFKRGGARRGPRIMRKPTVTRRRAHRWAEARDCAQVFHDIIDAGWPHAVELGVDPAVFVAQAAKETGFGRFGGVIDASFRNSCGLKTTKGGDDDEPSAHKRFRSWPKGTRAHCAHLALYAGAISVEEAASHGDPRAFPSVHGVARTVPQLGGKWAPDEDYGRSIVRDFLRPLQRD